MTTLPLPQRVAAPPAVPAGTLVSELVDLLAKLGVEEAFGVSGGAMAALWDALSSSAIRVRHFRHESGAAFAAIEAGFASGRPTLLFTTTGPGLTNAMTGILAAREERARVIVVSAYTSAASRGRFAIQETSRDTLPAAFYESGRLFHVARVIDDPRRLETLPFELAAGLGRRDGFVAHLALDTSAQRAPALAGPLAISQPRAVEPTPNAVAACTRALSDGRFVIWCGFGARDAAAEVITLARRMQAPVMCSARGKGVFPEDDPLFIGVTGLAGHASVMHALEAFAPRRILVLGSRLGEPTSFWDRRFVTPDGFVHIDVDPSVPGVAFADAPTLAVVGDVGATLRAVLAGLPDGPRRPPPMSDEFVAGLPRTFWGPRRSCTWSPPALPRPSIDRVARRGEGRVRPEALMDALQERVVDDSDAIVLAESGNSFLWATHRLRFARPGRYRVSTGVGAMGHAAAGVVGAALATGRRAVAIVGDGALLMTNEINTAVKYGARAVWVVLNDARYGMCAQGMASLGLVADAEIPPVDFAAFARAQGAAATRVDHETQLDGAFIAALTADGPFVIDVRIDPGCRAPASQRNAALAANSFHRERVFPSTGNA